MLGEGEYRDREYYPLPHLIVADFKLGGETGLDFFRWIKAQPKFQQIPVAVFSGSMMAADKAAAFALGLRATYSKDGGFDAVKRQVEQLLKETELPPEPDAAA